MKARTTLFALALGGCAIDTGLDEVTLDLQVVGTRVQEPFEGRDGARISLDQARLAFGPLYVCRGVQAGKTCDAAALEWTDAVLVDALDDQPRRVGTLVGTSGTVRSWMYDLGLHSTLTQSEPLVLEPARELGGHSVRLSGNVELDGQRLPFVAEVAVQPGPEAEQGVPMVQSANAVGYAQVVDARSGPLRVHFDPRPWLERVDFSAYVDTRRCDDPEQPMQVCQGTLEQQCAEDGSVAEERDCAGRDQICLPDRGCAKRIEVAPQSRAWRAIRNALAAGERPRFEW